MFSFFKKKPKAPEIQHPGNFSFLGCDMHSHMIPGIDDGSKTPEDSLEMIRAMRDLGYRKLITTPHVHGEFYDNTSDSIRRRHAQLQQYLQEQGIDMPVEAAAEYYLDSYFLSDVIGQGLLHFGDHYVLVEVSMAGWPRNLDEMIFAIQAAGYKPILAHPERYLYEEDLNVYRRLKDRGVLLQMNLLSVLGYYGSGVKTLANAFLAEGLYDFCGSDAHHLRHIQTLDHILHRHPELGNRLYAYGFKNATLLT